MNTFDKACLEFAPLHRMRREGKTAEDMVVAMLGMLRELAVEKEELLSIAPRRVRAPDGREYVWHCPDELIPTTDL